MNRPNSTHNSVSEFFVAGECVSSDTAAIGVPSTYTLYMFAMRPTIFSHSTGGNTSVP